MKLRTRLLMVPLAVATLMLALGAVAGLALKADSDAMREVNDQTSQALLLQGARAQVAEANAHFYRLVTIADNLDANRMRKEMDALGARRSSLLEAVERISRDTDDATRTRAADLRKRIDKAFKQGADAVDLASADANTGLISMQSADQEFAAFGRALQEFADKRRAAALASQDAARRGGERAIWVIWGAALGAIAITFALCVAINRRVVTAVAAARDFANQVAGGDLSATLSDRSSDELGQLQTALDEMRGSLARIVADVRAAADGIDTAAAQIVGGNGDLSTRTEAQAMGLQATTSSMENLTSTVRSNADSAGQANQLALSASEVAQRGGAVVGEVVTRMSAISESSRRIAEIIGVIDGIAFQTNILALNAAVEAARAGEQGRGFAVVAGEVRSLAQRSADAAREIKDLIGASVSEVQNGSALVRDAGATMQEIVSSVGRVSDIIAEISASTVEQNSQIGTVNAEIRQLDSSTQQNAALVEQSAAAAEQLRDEAQRLVQAVAVFRLIDEPARG